MRYNRSTDLADFPSSKMAATAILHFGYLQIVNGCDDPEGRTASACQVASKSLKTPLTYGDFSTVEDGRRPPSWIFKSWTFQLTVALGDAICVNVQNLLKIGQTVPEIWPILDFSRWRLPPCWILEISNFRLVR